MTQVQRNALAVKNWLENNGPFHDNGYALAANVGISYTDLMFALNYVRANVSHLGWTIPYQRRGGGWKDWRVLWLSHTTQPDDSDSGRTSCTIQRDLLVTVLTRTRDQAQLVAAQAPRSARQSMNASITFMEAAITAAQQASF
jgi:hypothetical protein